MESNNLLEVPDLIRFIVLEKKIFYFSERIYV